ncbi:MAG: GNAT family N-acetyltransferase [Coprobacillaceae bacterium]
MEKRIKEYLYRDKALNSELIVALQDGGEVLEFDEDGIFIKSIDDIYMISCTNETKGKQWIYSIDNCDLFVTHQDMFIEVAKQQFSFKERMTVLQSIYTKKTINVCEKEGIEIKKIDDTYFDIVKKYYSTVVDEEYLRKQMNQAFFFGAFMKEKIVGFVGIHEEGSIGFLEVLPEYQGLGIGTYLETHLIDQLLKSNRIVYAQIKVENKVSIRLHEKLGFTTSKEHITWLMK